MENSTISPDLKSTAAPTAADRQFFAVPVAILIGLHDLRCDIYIQHVMSSRKLLYRSAHTEQSLAEDEKVNRRNVRHFYLKVEDRERYDQAVREVLAKQPIEPGLHLALTAEQHREAFQVALASRSAAPVVAASQQIADDLVQVVKQDDFSVREVVSLLDHDQCTFQHSFNVAIYSATIGKQIGLSADELKLLTSGGLLHDIGKRQIPGFILRKPGKLNDRERELIRNHPTVGFRELAGLRQMTWAQLMMVYQHHEWANGKGYPARITAEEIHPWARICAIADVFDALTANRPYRETGHTDAAIEIMTKEAGHFDPELYRLWQQVVTA